MPVRCPIDRAGTASPPRSRPAPGCRLRSASPTRRPRPAQSGGTPASAVRRARNSSAHLDAVTLDDGIGQELLGRFLEGALGAPDVLVLELDVEHLALPHAGDPGDFPRLERAFDRL